MKKILLIVSLLVAMLVPNVVNSSASSLDVERTIRLETENEDSGYIAKYLMTEEEVEKARNEAIQKELEKTPMPAENFSNYEFRQIEAIQKYTPEYRAKNQPYYVNFQYGGSIYWVDDNGVDASISIGLTGRWVSVGFSVGSRSTGVTAYVIDCPPNKNCWLQVYRLVRAEKVAAYGIRSNGTKVFISYLYPTYVVGQYFGLE